MALTQDDFSRRFQQITSNDDPDYKDLIIALRAIDKGDAFSLVRQHRNDHSDSDASLLKQLMKDVIRDDDADKTDKKNKTKRIPKLDTTVPLEQSAFSEQVQLIDSIDDIKRRDKQYRKFLMQTRQMPNRDAMYEFAEHHVDHHPDNEIFIKRFISEFDEDREIIMASAKTIVKQARHHTLRKPNKYNTTQQDITDDKNKWLERTKDDAVLAKLVVLVYRTLFNEAVSESLEDATSEIELSDREQVMLQDILNDFGIVAPPFGKKFTQRIFSRRIDTINALKDPDRQHDAYRKLLLAARGTSRNELYQLANDYMSEEGNDHEIVKKLIEELDSEDISIAYIRQRVYKFLDKLDRNAQRKPNANARHQEIAEDRTGIALKATADPIIGAIVARVYRDTFGNGKLYNKYLKQAVEGTELTSEQEALAEEIIADLLLLYT